ncbi:MAG: serine/threonine-protein kinase [Gemmataceae bacterium]
MPSSRDSLPLSALKRIDSLCDRFEQEHRAGKTPRIEDYLGQAELDERSVLLRHLLRLEIELLAASGATPERTSYLRRFPSEQEAVDAVLSETREDVDASTIAHRLESRDDTLAPLPNEGTGRRLAVPGYEILGPLGGGGMGVVYRARHLDLNRLVALKTILSGGETRAGLVRRFRGEAEAVARLQHPHIVQIFDFGEADGVPYFTMELVEGVDLRQALRAKPLPDRVAAGLVETLARTMHVVHGHNIIHRDLKPANILLRGQAGAAEGLHPLISDFGLAKPLDDAGQTGAGTIVGTPSYMAPEQARPGKQAVGPATDVYALGAILYECLVGRPPFRAESALDTIYLVLEADPVAPRVLQPKLAADLETICLKCLHKDPARRYATALELAEDLKRYRDGVPIRARPAGPLERGWKWVRRHPRLVLATTTIFLALLTGILGVTYGLFEAWREQERAEREETRAKEESERARREERKARDLLAQSFAQTAQLAAQRGQWRVALEQLDKALAEGHPDTAGLLAQRVKALVALNDPRAFMEVEKLAARADLGEHEGEALLLRGDLALLTDHEKAIPLLRQALEKKLAPADRAYVQGLLADSTPTAARYWQEALTLDPFHYRANAMLMLALLFLGELDKASHRLAVGESLFPDDPSYQLMRAVLLTLRDDPAGAEKALARARPQLGEQEVVMAQNALELIGIVHQMGEVTPLNFSPLDKRMARAQNLGQRLLNYSREVRSESGSRAALALHPALAKSFSALPGAITASAFSGSLNPLNEFLGRSLKIHPEGTMYYVRGMALFAENRWYEAEEACLKAMTTPALSHVKRNALFLAVVTEGFLGRPNQTKPDLLMRRRAAENLRELLKLAPIKPEEAEILTKIARFCDETVLARQILEQWEKKAPESFDFLRQKTLVELQAGAYETALACAEKMVRQRPTDAEAQRLRAEAKKNAKR